MGSIRFGLLLAAFISCSISGFAFVMTGGQAVNERVNLEALNKIRQERDAQERGAIDGKVNDVRDNLETMRTEITRKDEAINMLTRQMALLCRKLGLTSNECTYYNPVTGEDISAENAFCYASAKSGNYSKGQWHYAKFNNSTGTLQEGYVYADYFQVQAGSSSSIKVTRYKNVPASSYADTYTKNATCTTGTVLNLAGIPRGCYNGSTKVSCDIGTWSGKDRSSGSGRDGRADCDAQGGTYCLKGSKCYAGSTRIRCGYKTCKRAEFRYCR